MSDRRRLWSNGQVAHVSLKGNVAAETYTEGEVLHVWHSVADLTDNPRGARQCQLLQGQAFRVLEVRDKYAFGFREADGYAGWVGMQYLKPAPSSVMPLNRLKVVAPRAEALVEPDVKQRPQHSVQLSFGSQVWHRPFADESKEKALQDAGWTGLSFVTGGVAELRYVRSLQLAPLDRAFDDPVSVAELFIHTPYVWGGDSGFGIDCSGLVQIALEACATSCPRDSDMQEAELGESLAEGAPLRRGDLLFWKGHVAWVVDPDTILHANAFHMAVAYEPLQDAISRIEAQGDGPVTARKRLGGQT